MAAPATIKVPFREILIGPDGLLSRGWQEFFRVMRDTTEGRAYGKTSSTFSLGTSGYASGEWAQMTNNSIALSAGSWRLSGVVIANWGSSSPTWSYIRAVWATANGANTTSEPANISPQAGGVRMAQAINNAGGHFLPMTEARLNVTNPTTVYLVPAVNFSAAGDATLQTIIYAERVSVSVFEVQS